MSKQDKTYASRVRIEADVADVEDLINGLYDAAAAATGPRQQYEQLCDRCSAILNQGKALGEHIVCRSCFDQLRWALTPTEIRFLTLTGLRRLQLPRRKS